MKYVTILTSLVIVTTAMAQEAPDRKARPGYLAVNIGYSTAVGSYSHDSESSGNSPGYATGGLAYQIELAACWSKYAGVVFEAGGFSNKVNQNPFKDDFTAAFMSQYPSAPPPTPSNAEPWKVNYLMGGPTLSFPWGGGFIDVK